MGRLSCNKGFTSLIFILIFTISSCSKTVQNETEVYFNDFETGDLSSISNGYLYEYNGSTVLGRYNQNGFELLLTDLPTHDLIQISFDLFIHDSWDGNKLGIDEVDGPDIWQLLIDEEMYINASFSNIACVNANGMFCPPQSFPENYPHNNNYPRKGAYRVNLPGACHPNGTTTWYKITKTISHSRSKLLLQCVDQLVQKNTDDPNCDESWSVDNIKINTIKLD
jgi:hypothetical protein